MNNFKLTDKLPILKPKVPPATAKPTKQERKQTTTFAPTTAGMKISTSISTEASKTSILLLASSENLSKQTSFLVVLQSLNGANAPNNVILG